MRLPILPEESTIPICDFSNWTDSNEPGSRENFLKTWDYAFRTFGFVMLVNHGLEKKYRALNSELELFFQLPLREKMTFRIAEEYGHGGYTPRGRENVSKTFFKTMKFSRPADAVESLVLSDHNVRGLPSIKKGYYNDQLLKTYRSLQSGLTELTFSVMELMAICLGLQRNFFFKFYEDKKTSTQDIRAAHYFTEPLEKGRPLPYGEHTDYTGFTFLWRSAENGLQCFDQRKSQIILDEDFEKVINTGSKSAWINVPILEDYEDAIVINAGDLIERWTNGYWISNVHRVLGPNPSYVQRNPSRLGPISVAHFTGPAGSTKVKVLTESAKVRSTGKIKAGWETPITASEHLLMKLNASNR